MPKPTKPAKPVRVPVQSRPAGPTADLVDAVVDAMQDARVAFEFDRLRRWAGEIPFHLVVRCVLLEWAAMDNADRITATINDAIDYADPEIYAPEVNDAA